MDVALDGGGINFPRAGRSSSRRHAQRAGRQGTRPATTGLTFAKSGLGREAHAVRADDAGLLHRGLQIVSAKPSTRLRHVGHILKDQDIIRVFGAAKHSAVRDACGIAALLMLVVTLAPSCIVLDFVVDSKVFGGMLCIHRHSPKEAKYKSE